MRNLIILLLICLSYISCVQAGVVIGGTRVVYGEGQNSVTLSLRNNSPFAWLINSKISTGGSWTGGESSAEKAPFVITPPLFTLKAGRENVLRVIYTGAELPRDRESLFTLNIATIPSGQVKDGSLQVAVRSHLKLFYRPKGLQGVAQDAYQQLRWSMAGHQLLVENPTPYYVTIFKLQVNGQEIGNAGIVSPFSQRKVSSCPNAEQCAIRWQGINDYGRVMPVRRNVKDLRH
ncbi:pili assembly chaperone [Buttiauxella sp. B2]|uniref:fimbria/pilus periplasmic chaperone n=1 Tax=Buttiauxella sp. B2 TaxID=2587812 RepID=UPI001122F2AF|nr:fimbria/pilus periplasmic chaperone [Buttiauxella sp. B2]TNV17206.1 pili assembly chaperone [Buttiauxella sp. B2]